MSASPAHALTPAEIELGAERADAGLQRDLAYLADNDLAGRNNLTEGSTLAQEYLIEQLREIGPGLVDGTQDDSAYRQPFAQGTNLLAVIPGRELPDEYVILGAHYDHLGTRTGSGRADQLLNGATDNAAGTAVALAVGRAIRDLGEAPRRSVIIALWDAEEDGLLGSLAYVSDPVVPLEQTVAYVNLDILGANLTPALARTTFAISGETGGVHLQEAVERAAHIEARTTSRDPLDVVPLSYIFGQLRSDYATFVAAEVPTAFFSDATGPCYHTPDDEVEAVDFIKLEAQSRVVYRVTAELAEMASVPVFVPPNPALATFDDALGLDRVFSRGTADFELFRLEDRAVIRRVLDDVGGIVARGRDSFGSADVQVLLNAALDTLDAVDANLECASFARVPRLPRMPRR
jgi:hypothetical protein